MFRLISILVITLTQSCITLSEINSSCGGIKCSNLYDPVCGKAKALDGSYFVKKFHNICHFNKIQCRHEYLELQLMNKKTCNIEENITYIPGRRINDFSIVGAHQACNHTCPTYCLDTYEPACAQIWKPDMRTYVSKPMINHCHIDLYSCVFGVNVTIQPLIGRCYTNPSALNFMFNIASLKTLNLLSRRSQSVNQVEVTELQDLMKKVFKIYR